MDASCVTGPGARWSSVQVLLLRTCHRIGFVLLLQIERERTTMIRWNKWTRDYTYTYEWHDGVWRLIHKKSNRPVVHWIKSWYTKPVKLTEYGQRPSC